MPLAILRTTPVLVRSAECGARTGTDSVGTCSASAIAETTAVVSQCPGEYQITTDAVRG